MRRLAAALPLLAALPVIAAYAAMLPAGKWQGDEYFVAANIARSGWHVLVDRVTGWSPRPLGEVLTWLYLTVSNALDRPLVGCFLAALWLAALAGIAVAGWVGRVRRPAFLALLLFALALLLIKPGEMFYWPMAAATFVPLWAGLAAATVLHRADLGRHPVALALALLVAVLSSEIGAATVLLYAGLLALGTLWTRRWRDLRVLIVPALCGAAVCVTVLRNRVQAAAEVGDAGSGLAGNWFASLRAGLPVFARETVGIEGLPLPLGAAVKLLLLVCLPPAEGRSAARAVLWALALLLGAYASIVLAYHQFGTLCCERHATLRQGMVLLALLAVAGLLGGALLAVRQIGLAALLLFLLGVRAAPLTAEWRGMGDVLAARQQTWASGAAPGDAMTLFLAPPSPIANADSLPPGRYRRTMGQPYGDSPWYAWGVMARFGKRALEIKPAEH